MAEGCDCGPSTGRSSSVCCGGAPPARTYDDGSAPYVTGEVDTPAGPVPRVSTELRVADRFGALAVRANIRRGRYSVKPGLYATGTPDDTSPVLVTANYKLSFDALRRELGGRDAWLLVLDTHGVNVWCAAGKGTFGSAELVRRLREVRLEEVVSHRKLIVPQLGATGVSAHEVRAASGYSVLFGPVRASDLAAFLDAGMKATPEMREVTFTLGERARLVGVELSVLWRPKVLAGIAAFLLLTGGWRPVTEARLLTSPGGISLVASLLAVVSGAAIAPLLLPWIPGRAFSLKGAIAGAVLIGALVAVTWDVLGLVRGAAVLAFATALSSYVTMNFTGSSTFTSPSGVEHEMRRAIPLQLTAGVLGLGTWFTLPFLR